MDELLVWTLFLVGWLSVLVIGAFISDVIIAWSEYRDSRQTRNPSLPIIKTRAEVERRRWL